MMTYSVIVLCAGSGRRTGLSYNKMFYLIDGQTIYEKTMRTFLDDARCAQVVVVCKDEEKADFQRLLEDERITYVTGGAERQDSVLNGLQAVTQPYVLIHDGARPYLTRSCIDALLKELTVHSACLLMVPCVDTIKRVIDGKVVETLVRSELMQAQTPQAFVTPLIRDAYQRARQDGVIATDDASLAEHYGHEVYAVMGDYGNIKVTSQKDLKK